MNVSVYIHNKNKHVPTRRYSHAEFPSTFCQCINDTIADSWQQRMNGLVAANCCVFLPSYQICYTFNFYASTSNTKFSVESCNIFCFRA